MTKKRTTEGMLFGGAIGAGEWVYVDPNAYGNALNQTGCNFVIIEAMGASYDASSSSGYNNKPFEIVIDELIKWIKALKKYRVTIGLHWVNGNDEIFGRFPLNKHKEALTRLINECGVSNIVICPVAEESGGSLEREWTNYCIDTWRLGAKGKLMYNGKGRPTNAPDIYDYLDYHAQRLDESVNHVILKPNQLLIIDTDSPVIRTLQGGQPTGYANPELVKQMATHARNNKAGFNLYLYNSKVIDMASLKAVAKAYSATGSGITPNPSDDTGATNTVEVTKLPVTITLDSIVWGSVFSKIIFSKYLPQTPINGILTYTKYPNGTTTVNFVAKGKVSPLADKVIDKIKNKQFVVTVETEGVVPLAKLKIETDDIKCEASLPVKEGTTGIFICESLSTRYRLVVKRCTGIIRA